MHDSASVLERPGTRTGRSVLEEVEKIANSASGAKTLVIGGGGREYSIVEQLASELSETDIIYCAPGNVGMRRIKRNVLTVPIGAGEIAKLADFAEENKIAMTIVGPDDPLADGIVDYFAGRGLKIFGPTQRAAMIESSKVFSYRFMRRHNITTPDSMVADDPHDALVYGKNLLRQYGAGVIKADGLAVGKGAVPYFTEKQLGDAIGAIAKLRSAGERMLVQKFVKGQECSFICWTDGERVVPMIPAQDHKEIYDKVEEKGGLWVPTNIHPNPNTGGMGAYTRPWISRGLEKRIMREVMVSAVQGMAEENRKFRGVLYAGLMITEEPDPSKREIYVLEFNARYGDPETQAVMRLLKSGLVSTTFACVEGNLDKAKPEWKAGESCYVGLATRGYPVEKDYRNNLGKTIRGLDSETLRRMGEDGVGVVHAGTDYRNGFFVNNSGRVLGVGAIGKDLREARAKCYRWIG
ncbi:MAG: phosphoribosylamine--glycine ligase, partial [Candidatus Aenigmatarchaeota archaeon]